MNLLIIRHQALYQNNKILSGQLHPKGYHKAISSLEPLLLGPHPPAPVGLADLGPPVGPDIVRWQRSASRKNWQGKEGWRSQCSEVTLNVILLNSVPRVSCIQSPSSGHQLPLASRPAAGSAGCPCALPQYFPHIRFLSSKLIDISGCSPFQTCWCHFCEIWEVEERSSLTRHWLSPALRLTTDVNVSLPACRPPLHWPLGPADHSPCSTVGRKAGYCQPP